VYRYQQASEGLGKAGVEHDVLPLGVTLSLDLRYETVDVIQILANEPGRCLSFEGSQGLSKETRCSICRRL
jgi:hypothetical protein